MRKILTGILLTLAASAAVFAQNYTEAAREELYEGARLYREGQYAEAERHFRVALELDPTGKNTRLFIARAIQQQYKPGDMSPANVAQGERAIKAYSELLKDETHRDDAYKATVYLYAQLKRDDKVVEMLTQRADDPSVAGEKRAEALVILASRHWQCSYDITERKENKRAVNRPDKILIHYKKPADPADFERARGCADEGLRFLNRALTLDPESVNVWLYRAHLFREEAKLAEMEGAAVRAAEYNRRYSETLDKQKRLASEAARKAAGDKQVTPADSQH